MTCTDLSPEKFVRCVASEPRTTARTVNPFPYLSSMYVLCGKTN
jgi:hypothetical protein